MFQIPAPAGSLKKNRFEFKLGDESVSLPKLEFLPVDADDYLDKMEGGRNVSNRTYIHGLVEAVDAEVGEKFRALRLTRDQTNAFYEAWQNSSKVTTGESSASAST